MNFPLVTVGFQWNIITAFLANVIVRQFLEGGKIHKFNQDNNCFYVLPMGRFIFASTSPLALFEHLKTTCVLDSRSACESN